MCCVKLIYRESEYAAWTLVNGYALNHVTISVHRLKSHLNKIKKLNQFLEEKGFKLNSEGGVLKGLVSWNSQTNLSSQNKRKQRQPLIYLSIFSVSPDGGLLQSSTVADSISFKFSDGVVKSIPCSYIEFAERLVLPQYQNVPESEVSVNSDWILPYSSIISLTVNRCDLSLPIANKIPLSYYHNVKLIQVLVPTL